MTARVRTPGEDLAVAAHDGQPLDLTRHRIERALAARHRYRYVRPHVRRDVDGSYRIESPCCSRNVDPSGGVIDIARLEPLGTGQWRLYSRLHELKRWKLQLVGARLEDLLQALCVDESRVFWP